jgi:hypothetical protein
LREINGSPEKPKKEKTNYALRKVSDSLRHVDKSAESISSFSSHFGDLKKEEYRLGTGLEFALSRIDHFRKRVNEFMGFNDQFSRQVVKVSEEQIYIWQSTISQLLTIKTVVDRLRERKKIMPFERFWIPE